MAPATDIRPVGARTTPFLRRSAVLLSCLVITLLVSLLFAAATLDIKTSRSIAGIANLNERRLRDDSHATTSTILANVLGKPTSITAKDIETLIQWHEGGIWEEMAGKLDAVDLYETVRTQALAWRHPWKPRFVLDRYADKPSEKIQILFLGTSEDYFMRIDRVFYDIVEVAMQNPYLNVTMFGPGWRGWDPESKNSDFEHNVKRKFDCDAFDIILYHEASFGADRCGNSKRAVIIQEIGDCPKQCMEFFSPKAHVHTNMYANAIREFFNMDGRPDLTDRRRLFAHNPHCVDPAKYVPAPWAPRQRWAVENHTVTLSGAVHGQWYPLRAMLADGARTGMMNVSVYKHQGWQVPYTGNPNLPSFYDVNEPRIQRVMGVQKDFATMMGNSAVCAFDSKSIKVLLRKYPEAMMTGCPILSDLPGELQDIIKPGIFEVPWPMTPAFDLAAYVNDIIADERGRALKGAYNMLAALEHLTCHSKLERWLDLADMYRSGERGYVYPFEHKVGCPKYLGYGEPHGWCNTVEP